MSQKIIISAIFSALYLVQTVFPFERISNYTSTLTVNDFAFTGDTVWAATSGGLYCYNRVTHAGTLFSNPSFFPDPSISAVFLDAKGNIWAGSANGFLTRKPPGARPTVITSYHTSGWNITDIAAYGRYLIVASDKGCSIFDTDKMVSIKNATTLGGIFQDARVNAVAVFSGPSRDTLLLGCYKGIAKLDISGDNLAKMNFYDPSIWTIDTATVQEVKSFAMRATGYTGLPDIGTLFKSQVVIATSTGGSDDTTHGIVSADSVEKLRLPSMVTAVAADNAGMCFLGTLHHYFYMWNGSDTVNVKIEGPTFVKANRVYVDSKSEVWVCPEISKGDGSTPWEGICRYYNGGWAVYNALTPEMGSIGVGNSHFSGVCEDPFNKMWFGTDGGNVKRYNREQDSWQKYCLGAQDMGEGDFFPALNCHAPDWMKCDAVARDSSGYMWFGLYGIYWGFIGYLMCYDPAYEPNVAGASPVDRHYRYFFPEGSPFIKSFIDCICVDRAGTIIAGSHSSDAIVVFKHSGNPLRDGVQVQAQFDNKGEMFDMAATADTLTYIATATGFYTYIDSSISHSAGRLAPGLLVRTWTDGKPGIVIADTTLKEISAVEIEDERFLWLGTMNAGLIRYDLTTNSGTVVDETAGLLSNRINDISIDRKNGCLWVASDRGVSRYMLGYALDKKNIGIAAVYPNPFSKRRHSEVVFEKLPPGSSVQVFTVGGTLVTTLLSVESSATGAVCVWKPPKTIVPGIYVYAVRSRSKSSQGRVIVTP